MLKSCEPTPYDEYEAIFITREKKSNLSLDVRYDYYYDDKIDKTNSDLDIISNSVIILIQKI